MHLICSEIDIFDCGLLWRPLLILYSNEFKSKMLQNHLCKKKTQTIFRPPTICCAAELYWGGSSIIQRVYNVYNRYTMVLGPPWRPRDRVYTMYRPPVGHIRPSPHRAAGLLELRGASASGPRAPKSAQKPKIFKCCSCPSSRRSSEEACGARAGRAGRASAVSEPPGTT